MRSLLFIQVRIIKNWLLELRRKPAKMAVFVLAAAALVFVIVFSVTAETEIAPMENAAWGGLFGMTFVMFIFMFFSTIKMGLSTGTAIYGMEDVNFVFISPHRTRTVLMYGIVKTIKTVALSALFIPFWAIWMRNSFNVGLGGLAVFFAAYILYSAVAQILTMFIYSTTNGRPGWKKAVRVLSFLIFAPAVIVLLWQTAAAGADVMAGLAAVIESPALHFTPIVGWGAAGIAFSVTGNYALGLTLLGLLLAFGAAMVAIIYKSNPDFYEDVLVATETAFEKQRSMAEGKMDLDNIYGDSKKVRIHGTGVGGSGASAFFFKHIRESFRANRAGLWGMSSLMVLGLGIGFAVLMRLTAEGEAAPSVLPTLLSIVMGMQIFTISVGRGMRETYSHYIYMIPASPFKKMLWANGEIMLKVAAESIVIFTAAGALLGFPALSVVLAILAHVLFAFMLLGISYASMRFLGTNLNAGVTLLLYFAVLAVVMAPGIIGAVFMGLRFGAAHFSVFAVLAGWELLMGLLWFYLSKGVLHNCDIATFK